MASQPDKKSRKAALGQWKAQQRAAALAKLPLPANQIQAMFGFLDAELPRRGCDNTLRLAREWCELEGVPFGPVDAWLLDNGGCCDCEALANSEQAFQDAIRDHDA